jgi:hypothetical protein
MRSISDKYTTEEYPESKQERHEKRRYVREAKMAKHGKSLGVVYHDAVLKRLGLSKSNKKTKS